MIPRKSSKNTLFLRILVAVLIIWFFFELPKLVLTILFSHVQSTDQTVEVESTKVLWVQEGNASLHSTNALDQKNSTSPLDSSWTVVVSASYPMHQCQIENLITIIKSVDKSDTFLSTLWILYDVRELHQSSAHGEQVYENVLDYHTLLIKSTQPFLNNTALLDVKLQLFIYPWKVIPERFLKSGFDVSNTSANAASKLKWFIDFHDYYEFTWFIDINAHFYGGNWSKFFRSYNENRADVVASNTMRKKEWYEHQNCVSCVDDTHEYSQQIHWSVLRLSRRMAKELWSSVGALDPVINRAWQGHHEAITALGCHRMSWCSTAQVSIDDLAFIESETEPIIQEQQCCNFGNYSYTKALQKRYRVGLDEPKVNKLYYPIHCWKTKGG